MKGPKITVKKSCFQCEYCKHESYEVQGDSGTIVFCSASEPRRRIGDTTWTTPEWCPLMAESVDPRDRRIAELEAKASDFDAEMTIAARALTAAFEDGRLDANDKRNGQLSDLAESKKWQTEQVDSLNKRVAELEVALKRAIRALVFADTPEARVVHFADLVVQLRAALAGEVKG